MASRRLAVIDTSDAGRQPMAFDGGRFWLVYNGEIYNHIELRDELGTLGHEFCSRSDTEVLLAAYAQWGEGCLERFNGMFAFVLWDGQRQTLFAARDRFGVKPLYWMANADGLAFASEIKQFTHLNGFSPRLNLGGAYDFLSYGLFDHNSETLLQGVYQLRPGQSAILPVGAWKPGEGPPVRNWYRPPQPGSSDLTAHAAADRFRDLLEDSVRLRLRSDVPVGSCLSGGLDSSSIVCLAAQAREEPLATVSACYDDPGIDERPYITAVNTKVNTKPVHVFPEGGELAESLDRLVHFQDGPFASTSVFAQWCVFRAARDAGVTVMLDGQGSDEQLAGYQPAFAAHQAGLLRDFRLHRLWMELGAHRRRHDISAVRQGAALIYRLLPRAIQHTVHRLRRIDQPRWMTQDFSRNFENPLPPVRRLGELLRGQFFETTLPMLLHYEDRNSMAHGIETRLPFLDYRLVELSLSLDERFKIVDGETKWLLRRAMEKTLPPDIRDRQDKVAFATPQNAWLRGALRSAVDDNVDDVLIRFPGIFSKPGLDRLLGSTNSKAGIPNPALWRVVCFAAWGRVIGVGF
jgi:asparagine synthase (glutamine-hydrolysing)